MEDKSVVYVFQFINKGRVYNLSCVKAHDRFFEVPIYYCKEIRDVVVLHKGKTEIIVVINPNYEERVGKEVADMKIWHSLVTIYYSEYNSTRAPDLCVATWYGFNKTIKLIEDCVELTDEQKKERVGYLEDKMAHYDNISIPSQEKILDGLSYKYI